MASSSGIYCFRNQKNGKRYIGQSVVIFDRKAHHIWTLNNSSNKNGHFQNAWNQDGQDSFEFSVLEFCPEELLNWREVEWIEKYKTINRKFGYNLLGGGKECQIVSDETKLKLSEAGKGKIHSTKTKEKMSLNQNGNQNSFFGKKHSLESRNKMSQSRKGKKKSSTHLENMKKSIRLSYILQKFYCA
jgi:group I intron endonuclease